MIKQPAIELKNITKRFGSKVIANKNVNLTAYRGEILSILGENGSGKTTLMNMISGIYFPDEGQIFIDGKEVVITSPKEAFKYKIGMIHQHFKLVDVFNATENIALGIENGKYDLNKSRAEIKKICDQYGFDISLDKKIYTMSVSEKQTVEIIKVLYRGADILILDDSSSALDYATDAALRAALHTVPNSPTVFIISQRTSSIRHADIILVMEDGRLVDMGQHNELLSRCDVYREIHESQFKKGGEPT